MTSMPEKITGGVDTHLDVHVAAALDGVGGVLGVEVFPATAKGYRALHRWLAGFGDVVLVGVEGTGSYGAGLTRHLHRQGVKVVEVDRPNRQVRRRRGKSDPADAVAAARSAMSGDASVEAKTRTGSVETIGVLRVVRHSARKDRTRAVNQMRSLISTAPEEIREDMRDLPIAPLLERAASFRPAGRNDVLGATKTALRMLAKRALALAEEIKALDAILGPIVEAIAHELVASPESVPTPPARSSSRPATTPNASDPKLGSPTSAASHQSTPPPANNSDTASTEEATARRTAPSGESS